MDLSTFINNSNFGSLLSTDAFITRIYLSSNPEHKRNSNDGKSYKESLLQIFDKNLHLIKNFNVETALGFSGNFSDSKNLYFQIEAMNENEIRFLKLSF
jgi:hypothetical protein